MAAERRCVLPLLILAALAGLLSPPCAADEQLVSPQQLSPGQALTNCGRTLTMQTDCNLVLYDGGKAIWASGTSGRGSGCRLTLQSDGNLVIYTNANNAVWASGTARGNGNYALVLQRDRNVVLYGGAYWATGTNTITFAVGAESGNTTGAVVVVNATAGQGVAGVGRKIDMVTAGKA